MYGSVKGMEECCVFEWFCCVIFGFFSHVFHFFSPPEPKPVYAQPGQPDVDLPVSPSDAPIPSAAHDEGMLRSEKGLLFSKKESCACLPYGAVFLLN